MSNPKKMHLEVVCAFCDHFHVVAGEQMLSVSLRIVYALYLRGKFNVS